MDVGPRRGERAITYHARAPPGPATKPGKNLPQHPSLRRRPPPPTDIEIPPSPDTPRRPRKERIVALELEHGLTAGREPQPMPARIEHDVAQRHVLEVQLGELHGREAAVLLRRHERPALQRRQAEVRTQHARDTDFAADRCDPDGQDARLFGPFEEEPVKHAESQNFTLSLRRG